MQEPLQFPDAPSRAQSDRILNWMSKRFGGGKGCAWIIADREGGAPVGAIRINRIDRGWRWGEIGYESHPDFWDRGLMTEAVRAVVSCAQPVQASPRRSVDLAGQRRLGPGPCLGYAPEHAKVVVIAFEPCSLFERALVGETRQTPIVPAAGFRNRVRE
jgi:hypothetical protein